MIPGTLQTVFAAVLNGITLLALAPFAEGLLRKLTARLQSRQGPPVSQPWFDLLKLLGKEDLESGSAPGMQRFAAYLSLATTLTLVLFLPLGYGAPLGGFGDVLLLAYLLTLSSVTTLLAGLAAGSTFSMIGISREMMTLIALEPLLVVALLVGAVHTQSLRIDTVLNGGLFASSQLPLSGALMTALLLLSLQGFLKRVPYDTAEAETEIMEGPLIEYSGPKLALFKLSHMCKLLIYAALFVNLVWPPGSTLPLAMAIVGFWAKVALVVLLATVVAATHARYRIDQALRRFAVLLALAVGALALATQGY